MVTLTGRGDNPMYKLCCICSSSSPFFSSNAKKDTLDGTLQRKILQDLMTRYKLSKVTNFAKKKWGKNVFLGIELTCFFWLPPKKKSRWLTQPTDHEIKVETLFSFQVVVIPKSLVRLARKLMEKGFRSMLRSSSQNPSHPLFSLMRSYALTRRVDNLAAYSSFLGMLSLLFNPAAYPLKTSS